jgi:hypothetical protein
MNDWLAQMYNTNGAGEELEKQAQMDLFCKLAAEQNIDLSQMSEEEVGELYAQVFSKEAEEGEGKCEDCGKGKDECSCGEGGEGGEKTSAVEHWMQKRAFQEKVAEADMMGRVMAHAFTQELELIKEAAGRSGGEVYGTDADWRGKGDRAGEKAWKEQVKKVKAEQAEKGSKARAAKWEKRGPAAGSGASGGKSMSATGAKVERLKGFAKTRKGKAALIGGGAALAAGAAYGGYKAAKGKKKAASAQMEFEDEACLQACKTASAAGYDIDEAMERVDAVQNLGLEETEKVAHVAEFEDAVHVRGLEYLEAAGYPVNWDEVFGEE